MPSSEPGAVTGLPRQATQSAPLPDLDVQLLPAAGVAAVMAWGILQARMVQLRHRSGAKTAWRQPSGSPRHRTPASAVMAGCLPVGAAPHRSLAPPQPVQFYRQRSGAVLQVLQVTAAVERPAVDAARTAASVAGLRGARTGVVGPRPATACVALVEPRAGRDGDLPGPTRLPAAHQVSPPLAWLPNSDQPPCRGHGPAGAVWRSPTVLPSGQACRARSGCGRQPATAQRPARPRPQFLPARRVGAGASLRVRAAPGWLAAGPR
jgi:hypothetical protein